MRVRLADIVSRHRCNKTHPISRFFYEEISSPLALLFTHNPFHPELRSSLRFPILQLRLEFEWGRWFQISMK